MEAMNAAGAPKPVPDRPAHVMRGVPESMVTVEGDEAQVPFVMFDGTDAVTFKGIVPASCLAKSEEPHSYDIGLPDGDLPVAGPSGERGEHVRAAVLADDWAKSEEAHEANRGKRAWLLGIDPLQTAAVEMPSADGSSAPFKCLRVLVADRSSSPLDGAVTGYGRFTVPESCVFQGEDGRLDVYMGREHDMVTGYQIRLGWETATGKDVWAEAPTAAGESVADHEAVRRLYGSPFPDRDIVVSHEEAAWRSAMQRVRSDDARSVPGVDGAEPPKRGNEWDGDEFGS